MNLQDSLPNPENRNVLMKPRLRASLEARRAEVFLIVCSRSAVGATLQGRRQLSYMEEC